MHDWRLLLFEALFQESAHNLNRACPFPLCEPTHTDSKDTPMGVLRGVETIGGRQREHREAMTGWGTHPWGHLPHSSLPWRKSHNTQRVVWTNDDTRFCSRHCSLISPVSVTLASSCEPWLVVIAVLLCVFARSQTARSTTQDVDVHGQDERQACVRAAACGSGTIQCTKVQTQVWERRLRCVVCVQQWIVR